MGEGIGLTAGRAAKQRSCLPRDGSVLVTLPEPLEDLLDDLPTLPATPLQVMELTESPESCDLRELAAVVRRDPVIAARLLRMANTAFFSAGAWTESVIDAVTRLGVRETRKIVLTVGLLQTFREPGGVFDIRRFWTFNLASALCAEELARVLDVEPRERAYLAGLLHRISDITLALAWPDRFARAVMHTRERGSALDDGIEKVFQVSSSELSASILQRWEFPSPLVDAVAKQARPSEIEADDHLGWTLLISDRLCRLLGTGFENPPHDGLDWIESVPEDIARRIFPESRRDLLGYIAERWGFLQDLGELVTGLFEA